MHMQVIGKAKWARHRRRAESLQQANDSSATKKWKGKLNCERAKVASETEELQIVSDWVLDISSIQGESMCSMNNNSSVERTYVCKQG